MALRRKSLFPLILTFFGLTYEYRLTLFNQIHEICFHGQGGYDWETVYNLPIWLRTFIYKKMSDFLLTGSDIDSDDDYYNEYIKIGYGNDGT